MASDLEQETERLRRLVACDDFAGAEASARRYRELVAEDVKRLPCEKAETRLQEAMALLRWARRSFFTARGALISDLRSLQRAAVYQGPPAEAIHTWRMEG